MMASTRTKRRMKRGEEMTADHADEIMT